MATADGVVNKGFIPTVAASSTAESLMQQVASVNAIISMIMSDIMEMQKDLRAKSEQLHTLQASPPSRSAYPADADGQKRYDAALGAHNASIEQLQSQIQSLTSHIARKTAELERKVAEAQNLASRIPAAQAEDRERVQKQIEAAKKLLEQQPSQTAAPDGKAAYEDDDKVVQKRRTLGKVPVVPGGGIPSGGVP